MTGMMAAMALGMVVGLLGGVILGIMFSGNLFISTILGMLIGIIVGGIAGFPVSVMAVLDGVLAGLMGGMMGAMLGEMVAPIYYDKVVKVFFVIFIGIALMLLYLLRQETKASKEGVLRKMFHHPILLLTILLVYFYIFNQLGPVMAIGNEKETKHQHQGIESQNRIVVYTDEFQYNPLEIKSKIGEKITLVLKNRGKVEHDLDLKGVNAEVLNQTHVEGHGHQAGIHLHVKPGEESELAFIPKESGSFEFFCTIPGHKESGMVGTLIVNE
jgi:uncharacterized cupredoxin-like copper-binding protein